MPAGRDQEHRFSNRVTPGAAGFFILSQLRGRPERYEGSRCFGMMPSRPSLQACSKTSWPSPSTCSLYWIPAGAAASMRDELAARLKALYLPFCSAIVPILTAIEQLDVEIRMLNHNAPPMAGGNPNAYTDNWWRAAD
jgi:hypothetical protein